MNCEMAKLGRRIKGEEKGRERGWEMLQKQTVGKAVPASLPVGVTMGGGKSAHL